MSPLAATPTPTPIDERFVQPTALDARYPIALLPLRLETRFAGEQLRVRIFPDEIFADTHEPGLTADEQRDGAAYVAAIQSDAEPQQWAALVTRYGAPRAAWIALASAKGSPAARADSWTRAAQAVLPDSWIVRAYRGASVFTVTIPVVKQPLALTVSPNPGTQVKISDGLSIDADVEWTLHFDAAVAAGMAVTIDLTKPDGTPTTPPTPPHPVPPRPTAPIGISTATAPAELTRVNPVPAVGTVATQPVVLHPIVDPPITLRPPVGVDVIVIGVKNLPPEAGAAQLQALLDAQHYTRGFAFVAPGTPTSNGADATAEFPPRDPGAQHSFAVERQAPLVTPNDGSDGDRFALAFGLIPSAGQQVAAVEHADGADRKQDPLAAAMNGALWPATLGYFMEQMMAPKFDAATVESARQYFIGSVRPGGPLPAFRVGRVPYGILPVLSLSRFAPDGPLSRALRTLRDDHFTAAAANMPRVTPGSTDPDGDLLKALAVDASCRQVRVRTLLGQDVTSNSAGIFGIAAALALEEQQAARAASAAALLSTVGLDADTRIGKLDPGTVADLLGAPLVTGAPLSESSGVDYIQTLIGWASANPIDVASIRDDKLPGRERPLLYRVLRHALLSEMDRVSVPPLMTAKLIATTDRTEPELVNLGPTPSLTAYGRIDQAVSVASYLGSLQPYLGYLRTLAPLPSAELERRFSETLDACSHRLEAWITSLATSQLWKMRAAAPTGCHFGAFGWVENVLPATATSPAGGFIHAPSAAHASAAAILRNGYLSRGGGGSPYAVDLSSARVRDALRLLDGTRQGESLSALLGYAFERELHERQLDRLIAPLRSQFPLVAGKTPAGVGAVESVAASNVVDGLALRAHPPAPSGLTSVEAAGFAAALASLDGAVDGLADLLTAESVFQAVRGNPTAAVAALDAMAQGTLPPEVDVVRSPAGGTAFTQRLAVILDGTGTAPASSTPRATAEPFLDAWAGALLGDLSRVGCDVIAADGTKSSVTLAALGLRPLDLIALAKTPASGFGDGELDRRVLDAAAASPGAKIQYDATDVAHSFSEWMELARTIGVLIGGARALLPADLVAPADGPGAPVTDQLAQAAAGRAQAALADLAAAATRLSAALAPVAGALADATQPAPTAAQLSMLRTALQAAALFGVSGAYPANGAGAAELATAAAATVSELAARQSQAPPLTVTDATALLAAATGTMATVFGRDFLFLPQITPSAPAELAAALTESPSLIADPNLPRQLLQQMARVRTGVGRWRSLFLYAEALGTLSPAVDVAQLPTGQTSWAAAKGAAPVNGTVSLLLHRPTQTAPTATCAGLVIDEWNELIPAATQTTSIGFRHETPVAEAPQAVLLAVPPTASPTWDEETLFDTVREALMLAKVRLVDTVDDLRPFLPAICLTGNTANETVSTNFLTSLIADPVIARSS